jgi:hypothetical protein
MPKALRLFLEFLAQMDSKEYKPEHFSPIDFDDSEGFAKLIIDEAQEHDENGLPIPDPIQDAIEDAMDDIETIYNRKCNALHAFNEMGEVEIIPPFTQPHFFTSYILEDNTIVDVPKGDYSVRAEVLFYALVFCLVEFLKANETNRKRVRKCEECKKFYIAKTIRPSRFCSNECRLAFHNREGIQSGKNREYKRKKREEGAKASYYG